MAENAHGTASNPEDHSGTGNEVNAPNSASGSGHEFDLHGPAGVASSHDRTVRPRPIQEIKREIKDVTYRKKEARFRGKMFLARENRMKEEENETRLERNLSGLDAEYRIARALASSSNGVGS